jgi:BarA-like signal transduction histidine kinase
MSNLIHLEPAQLGARVELHDLNRNPVTVTVAERPEDVKDPADQFIVELCLSHRDTITMGKLIAYYKPGKEA